MEGMFRILVLFAYFFCVSNGFSILNETIKCRNYCERTYPLHTYPTVKHFHACLYGCYVAARQKSLMKFGYRLKRNCSQGCLDHFATGSYFACKLGCAQGNHQSHEDKTPTKPAVDDHSTVAAMILRPVMLLHTYGRGMINRLTYYIQSSTSYYFRTQNGGMVVVNIQNRPQLFVSSSKYSQTPAREEDENTPQEKQNDEKQHETWIVVHRGRHWLHCVSHKSGIPMWILGSILFLSSFLLLWLCCAAAVPSRKKTQKREKKAFLIKEFLSAQEEKDDVPLLNIHENEEQAEALPSKAKPAAVISF